MKIRLLVSLFAFIVILSLPVLVFAKNNRLRVNQDQALPDPQTTTDTAQADLNIPIPILVEQLNLKLFDAANGDLSICLGEAPCLYFAQQIKAWRCASNVCEQDELAKSPVACFADQFMNYSPVDQAKISQSVCSIVKTRRIDARMSLLEVVPEISEHVLVENTAYLWAFKKNVDQCVSVIKDYVGEFGPKWNFRWYRALSGCRILAQESTREKEESDFLKWLNLERGEGQCTDLKNKTLREACKAPGASFPKPGFEFLPGITRMDSDSIQAWLDGLLLNEFLGAASGDSSLCKDNQECLDMMDRMKSWDCAQNACKAGDESKDPASCFEAFLEQSPQDVRKRFNELVCPLIDSPNDKNRRAFLGENFARRIKEEGIVLDLANLLAVKGSGSSCQERIKDYFGAYGAQWKPVWYVALSGCRILSGESTYEQERKDFATWFAVLEGAGNCSGIMNGELKNACSTPGATSPKPVAEK